MTPDEMLADLKQILDQMWETAKKKNSDYTGANPDPFFNLSMVELLGVTSTEVGILTRMTDKFSRIVSFCQKGTLEVKTESVEDTLQDLSVYSLLLLLYIRAKKKRKEGGNEACSDRVPGSGRAAAGFRSLERDGSPSGQERDSGSHRV